MRVVARRPAAKLEATFGRRICCLCLCVLWPCLAANLEATFGRRRGCLCICVLLAARQEPNWKLHQVAELVVCVNIRLVVQPSGVRGVQH